MLSREGATLDQMTLDTDEDVMFWIGRAGKCGSAILEEMSKRMKVNFDLQYSENLTRAEGDLKR